MKSNNKNIDNVIIIIIIISNKNNNKISTLLRSARILRKVLEIWGNLLSLKLQWKTIN